MAGSRIDQLIDPVQREAVLQTGIVQVSEVDTDAPLPALLLDDNGVGEPGGVLHFTDSSGFQQPVDFFDDSLSVGRRRTSWSLNYGAPVRVNVQRMEIGRASCRERVFNWV